MSFLFSYTYNSRAWLLPRESYKIERKGKEVSTHPPPRILADDGGSRRRRRNNWAVLWHPFGRPSSPPSKNGLYSFSPFSDGREGGGGRKKDTRTHSSWGLGRGRGGGPKKRRLSILWQCWVSRGEGGRGVLPIKRRFLACRKKKKGSPVSPPDRQTTAQTQTPRGREDREDLAQKKVSDLIIPHTLSRALSVQPDRSVNDPRKEKNGEGKLQQTKKE